MLFKVELGYTKKKQLHVFMEVEAETEEEAKGKVIHWIESYYRTPSEAKKAYQLEKLSRKVITI